jgi:predicted nucleotide-binding protein
MAKGTSPPQPASRQMTPDELDRGIKRLERRLAEVSAFDPRKLDPIDPRSTTRPVEGSIESAISETFGPGTIEYIRFRSAAHFDWPLVIGRDIPHQQKIEHVSRAKQRAIQLLTAAIDLLKDRLDDHQAQSSGTLAPKSLTPRSNRIFIVHGRDNETKESIARFVTRLGLEPVILHEQANKGRTIIEKFREEAADIGFAVVLMTPDDETAEGTMRARQNVILELGFFLGQLGNAKVAALVKGDVETPSDFDGVLYVQVDESGAWRFMVAKELKAAGYEVDLNKLF